MTYSERKEFEKLEKDIQTLSTEKATLEQLFNSGDVITDMDAKSRRYNELSTILDEKEMRWLELSEKE
ncbi:MAG: hypothetical protein K2L41_02440 [Muribaculaceae bacterium]|nr:hypothetical protein [Muribaculaceae bacterium]